MLKVTNNEYQEILRKEADEYWTKVFALPKDIDKDELDKYKNQYWKEMDEILNQYEIIPFEVNTKSKELNALINKLCDKEEHKNSYCKIYRGFTRNDYGWYNLLQSVGITENIEGGDSYNQTYGSKELLTTANYCEGDLTFVVCDTLEDYNREVTETEEFYAKNY